MTTVDGSSQSIRALFAIWRSNVRWENYAAQLGPQHRAHRSAGLTQEDMAMLLGKSMSHYTAIERGERTPSGEALVQDIANILMLSATDREVLFQRLLGHAPPAPTSVIAVPARLRAMLTSLPYPAFVLDTTWTVVAANGELARWLPVLGLEPNLLRYVCWYPGARETLLDWETSWLAPMLAELRFALNLRPDSPGLLALVQEITERGGDPARLWTASHEMRSTSDGERRTLMGPDGVATVELTVVSPAASPELRQFVLTPVAIDHSHDHGQNGPQPGCCPLPSVPPMARAES